MLLSILCRERVLIPVRHQLLCSLGVQVLPKVFTEVTPSAMPRWIGKKSEVALREDESVPQPDSIEGVEDIEPETMALVMVQDSGPQLVLQICHLI
jgi:hypothetical protein